MEATFSKKLFLWVYEIYFGTNFDVISIDN